MYLLKHVDFESRSRSINSEQDIPKTSKEIIAADRKKLAASVRTGTTRSQRMPWGRTECTRPNPVISLVGQPRPLLLFYPPTNTYRFPLAYLDRSEAH